MREGPEGDAATQASLTAPVEPGGPEVRRVRGLDQMSGLRILNQGQQMILPGFFHLLEDLGTKVKTNRKQVSIHVHCRLCVCVCVYSHL